MLDTGQRVLVRLVVVPTVAITSIVGLSTPASALTPNEKFVIAVHEDFLGRAPTSSELLWWTTVLGTSTRGSVVQQILRSTEFKTNYITWLSDIYMAEVPPGTSEGNAYLSALTTSHDYTEAEASIFGGAMYFQNAESSNEMFVGQLYFDVLQRAGSATDVAYWKNELDTAARTRLQVGRFFIRSSEARARRVRGSAAATACPTTSLVDRQSLIAGSYCIVLDRMAGSGEETYWVSYLATADLVGLWTNMAASTEYFNNAQ